MLLKLSPTSVASKPVNVRLIHVGCRNSPCFIAFVHQVHHLVVAGHHQLRQILNVRAEAAKIEMSDVSNLTESA